MRWLLTAATVLLIVAACGDGDADDSTTPTLTSERPTVTATASATAITMPRVTATLSPRTTSTDPNAIELWQGSDTQFPDDMAIYIEPGCFGCAGVVNLVRLYRDPTGEIRNETVIGNWREEPFASRNGNFPNVTIFNGSDVSADGSVIVVGLCIEQSCGAGGIGDWHPDSVTAVLRSNDGGITWQEIARGGPALSMIGLVGDDQILTMNYLTPVPEPLIEFRLLPSGELVEPPIGALSSDRPLVASGHILWRAEDGGLLLSDGTEFVPSPDAGRGSAWSATGESANPESRALTVRWSLVGSTELRSYAIEDSTATLLQTFFTSPRLHAYVWRPPETTALITIIPLPLNPDSIFPLPARLNTATGEYRLIKEGFLSDDDPPQWLYGRSYVRAFQTGPFARVVDTGSCLNVRAEPSLAAQVLDCMADGVLLRDLGEVSEADNVTWVRVSTPAGVEGWTSAKFLER